MRYSLARLVSIFLIAFTLVVSLGIALPASPARASSNIIVNTNTDDTTTNGQCSLREAMTNANNDAATYPDCIAGSGADTITFDSSLSGATITLGSDLPAINTTLTIDGSSLASQITLSGNNAWRVFLVNSGKIANIHDLKIENGNGSVAASGCAPYTCGGGILNYGTLTVTNVTFTGNEGYLGGGIFNFSGSVTVTNSQFTNNTAETGGALYNLGVAGTIQVNNSTFTNNSAVGISSSGGAIRISYGTVTISNSTFHGNSAAGGGAIVIADGGTLNVSTSTFTQNTSGHSGGAINIGIGGFGYITNTTFSGNSGSQGGAIAVSAPVQLTNSTLSGNIGTIGGGSIYNFISGGLKITNTIITNSTGGDCINGPGASLGSSTNNLVSDAVNACDLTDGTNGNKIGPAYNVNLGALANNGGSTQTMALLSGSDAINAGTNVSCPATDQRGVSRPQGVLCDIGAYEVPLPSVGLSTASHNFGGQLVNTSSAPFTFTITNTGAADLNLGTLGITGEYSLSNNNCNGVTLTSGNNCTFDVTFSPLSIGAKSGSVSIPSNAGTSPDSVSLNGTGIMPDLVITQTNNVGGTVALGNSWLWAVRVTNQGTANAVIPNGVAFLLDQMPSTNLNYALHSINSTTSGSKTYTTPPDMSVSAYLGSVTIAPGQYYEMVFTVTPTATGTYTSPRAGGSCLADPNNVVTESDESNNTCAADTVTVTAVPAVSLSSTSLNFGNQLVGVASAPQTVTVTNSGNADLHIGSLGITGDFGLSNDNCSSATVAPGNSCTFDVIFQPLSTGAKTGTVTIPSDGTNAPNFVSLDGSGVYIPDGTNLLKKSDFSGVNIYPAPWQPVGFRPPYSTVIDCVIFQSGPCSVFFGAGNRAAQQRVNFPGHTGDSFLYGISTASQNAPLAGNYRLDLTFFNSQNRIVGRDTINFNTGTNPFTIYLDTFTAPANFSYIIYRFTYQKSGGAAWFDDAFLMVAP